MADVWPPRIITSTKMPIQFHVDEVKNEEYPEAQLDRPPWGVMNGDHAKGRLLYSAGGINGRGPYVVDVGWPQSFTVKPDMSSLDEGACDLLYGLVRAIRPSVSLETGTHKGRSTHAIASALALNEFGHVTTLDVFRFVKFEEILPEQEWERITQVIGESPNALYTAPLADLTGIDFAYLDGAHDGATLKKEIEYVDAHRGPSCTVVIDNAMDAGWPEIRELLDAYTGHKSASIETMSGMEIIYMADEKPTAREGATHTIVVEDV